MTQSSNLKNYQKITALKITLSHAQTGKILVKPVKHGNTTVTANLAQGLICGMTDLEEGNYLVYHHFVVLFLLLDKLVLMFSREGVNENRITLP